MEAENAKTYMEGKNRQTHKRQSEKRTQPFSLSEFWNKYLLDIGKRSDPAADISGSHCKWLDYRDLYLKKR